MFNTFEFIAISKIDTPFISSSVAYLPNKEVGIFEIKTLFFEGFGKIFVC